MYFLLPLAILQALQGCLQLYNFEVISANIFPQPQISFKFSLRLEEKV
jgi:hypothetical protein